MKIFSKFPIVNKSKLHFWWVICFAKNLIWTTLEAIFSIFRFFEISSVLTNHTSMESFFYSAFRWCRNVETSKNWPLWLVLLSMVTSVSNYSDGTQTFNNISINNTFFFPCRVARSAKQNQLKWPFVGSFIDSNLTIHYIQSAFGSTNKSDRVVEPCPKWHTSRALAFLWI